MNIEGEEDSFDLGAIYDQLEAGVDASTIDVSTPATPQPAADAPQAVQAPEHWSAQDRELFGRAPPEHQEWLLNRHRAMEGDYTRRMQVLKSQWGEVEQKVAFADQVRNMFTPLAHYGASQGLDEVGMMRMASAYMQAYYNDPAAFARFVASQAGIELPQPDQDAYQDPEQAQRVWMQQELAKRDNALAQIYQQQQNGMQAIEQARQAEFAEHVHNEAQRVMTAKDEKGQLLYPLLQNPEIAKLIGTVLERDAADDFGFEEAYAKVAALIPPQHQQTVTRPQAPAGAQRVSAARNAATGISGGSHGIPAASRDMSIREALEDAWSRAGGT